MNDPICTALMAAIEAADGVVIVDGRRMIRRDVMRTVVQAVMTDLITEMRERLPATVTGGSEAEKHLTIELDKSARRIEKCVADMFPVFN